MHLNKYFKMIIGIHQPNFIPWIGFFYKINQCDLFVLLDDVQFTKNSLINRNKIKTAQGEQWVTMPVLHSGSFGQNINETRMVFFEKHYKKFIRALQINYSKAPYFNEIMPLFSYNDFSCDLLSVFNESIIRRVAGYLEIQTPIKKSSELTGITGCSTERLISICKYFGADKYLAGFGSRNYQDDELFIQSGIEPMVSNFKYPYYNQMFGPFLTNLSVVDVLMNIGKSSIQYI